MAKRIVSLSVPYLKDACLCLSTANLLFLGAWEEVNRLLISRLPAPPDSTWIPEPFPRPVGPGAVALFNAILLSISILTVVLWMCLILVRKAEGPWLQKAARFGFLLLIMGPLDFLCWKIFLFAQSHFPIPVLRTAWSLVLAIPLLGGMLLLLYDKARIYRTIRTIVLILSPLFPIKVVQVGLNVFSARHMIPTQIAGHLPSTKPGLLIWMIFDEFDQRLAFERRPVTIRLPEFDRLEQEALYATRAKAPASSTAESMASLFSGQFVKAYGLGGSPKGILFTSGTTGEFGTISSVFSEARSAGFNTALTGWLIPYCQAFGDCLSSCADATPDNLKAANMINSLEDIWNQQLEENWLVMRLNPRAQLRVPWPWKTRKEEFLGYQYIKERAHEMMLDPKAGLVVVHWPIPHPLGIYDRFGDEITLDGRSNYLDNLELVDRSLGEVRGWLEEANLWARTSLIVSSDHPFRPEIWGNDSGWTKEEADLSGNRTHPFVPFIVKIAGSSRSLCYDRPINTVISKNLVLSLLKGEMSDVDQLAEWLDRQGTSSGGSAARSVNGDSK